MKQTKKKNQKLVFIIIFVIAFIMVFAAVFFFSFHKTNSNVSKNPFNSTDTIFFYYGYSCTHCQDVENYMKENNIKVKLSDKNITLVKKETFKNEINNVELSTICNSCNISNSGCGVPMVYYQKNCYMGTTDVLAFLDNMTK